MLPTVCTNSGPGLAGSGLWRWWRKKKKGGRWWDKRGLKRNSLPPPSSLLPPPSSGPCECLPGKRENRENLLRERRRGGGDATDGERGGVTAEREEGEEGAERERWAAWFIFISADRKTRRRLCSYSLEMQKFFYPKDTRWNELICRTTVGVTTRN